MEHLKLKTTARSSGRRREWKKVVKAHSFTIHYNES